MEIVELIILGAAVCTILGFGITILIILLKHSKEHGELSTRVEYIEKLLFNIVLPSRDLRIIEIVRQFHPSKDKVNPYEHSEKERLLEKYQHSTLNLEEARRLQEILNEDMEHAGDNTVVAIAIALLLVGVAALIAYLLSRR